MLTREQILEIQSYCAEHGVSQKDRLEELNINLSQFYRWQQKYRQEDEQSTESSAFVQLRPGGEFVSPMMSPAKTSGKAKPTTKKTAKRNIWLDYSFLYRSRLSLPAQRAGA